MSLLIPGAAAVLVHDIAVRHCLGPESWMQMHFRSSSRLSNSMPTCGIAALPASEWQWHQAAVLSHTRGARLTVLAPRIWVV
ncbi:hypothetical protein NDU88_007990 [Pleurodeles waltl]|uniref:Secreted protein n=1 Tax=Pleurodeles waltl TaxID=8319 RepID=A0AAV7RWG0_PLEWA|nr:hypothetical protein NDU88_007990 [Pleurodeles waltl]